MLLYFIYRKIILNIINNILPTNNAKNGWPPVAAAAAPPGFTLPLQKLAALPPEAAAPAAPDATAAEAVAIVAPMNAAAITTTTALPRAAAVQKTPGDSGADASSADDAWLALVAVVLPTPTPAPLPTPAPSAPVSAGASVAACAGSAPASPAATTTLASAADTALVAPPAANAVTPALTAVPDKAAATDAAVTTGEFQNFAEWMQRAEGLAAAVPPPAAAPAAAPQATLTIPVPVNHSGWGEALAHHVVWSVMQDVQQVQIQIHPEALGPVSIHLRLDQDQAQIAFIAPHAQTREAIEQALPQLRELLRSEGIGLEQASVQSQLPQQGGGHAAGDGAATRQPLTAVVVEETEPASLAAPSRLRRGLVDDYV